MISFVSKGSLDRTEQFLRGKAKLDVTALLNRYGAEGVRALSGATPVDSGETAQSWSYEIVRDSHSTSIIWNNSHVENGRPIAILLQYGHATRTGGYVQGRDYINPAMRPIFDQIEAEVRKAVTSQ